MLQFTLGFKYQWSTWFLGWNLNLVSLNAPYNQGGKYEVILFRIHSHFHLSCCGQISHSSLASQRPRSNIWNIVEIGPIWQPGWLGLSNWISKNLYCKGQHCVVMLFHYAGTFLDNQDTGTRALELLHHGI